MPATDLFKFLASKVFVVEAYKSGRTVAQGSAVAVDNKTLFTNCHVLNGSDEIIIRQVRRELKGQLIGSMNSSDRCLISVDANLNSSIKIRPFSSLEIGETVYALGAPRGFDYTLSNGIISSLRISDQYQNLVQTTAPISPGSSGGGLFDRFGNLIGITTMTVNGSQNLNFAIAAEDFLR